MNPPINFNLCNLLIAAGSIQGFIFSIVVICNRKYKSNSNFYLSLLIAAISLNNLYYWFIDINYISNLENYKLFYIPWALLITPMYYFFVISYLNKKKVKLKFNNYLIFPFYVFLLLHISISSSKTFFNLNEKIYLIFIDYLYYTEEYFSAIFTLIIIYYIYNIIIKHEENNKTLKNESVKIETKWLKNILYCGILISIIWLLMIAFNQLNSFDLFSNKNRYFLWISNSALIYYLGYLGIYHNGIFKQRREIRKTILLESKSKKNTNNDYKLDKIKKIIEEEKIFLNPNLSLTSLSDRFELNESYFSYLFNKNSDINISNYINKLRVETVKSILLNKDFKNYTLISIALESGFNSKSAFYTAFKKETGLTPTAYRKQNLS